MREGAALLQGLLRCGKCGRRMRVHYPTNVTAPVYVCNEARIRLAANKCQTIRGDGIEQAVTRCFLEALQPAQLEIALAAFEQLEIQAQQFEHQWKLRLERAEYEANLAKRRFMAVEPENRLVGRSLEQDWNAKLEELEKLRQEYAGTLKLQVANQPLTPQERQRIVALAQNIPAIWWATTTSQAERKQLLRFLIRFVSVKREDRVVNLEICWQTEARTYLTIAAPVRSCDKYRTDPALIEQVRELAVEYSDTQILERLIEQGWCNSHGQALSLARVRRIRRDNGINLGSPERPGHLGIEQRNDGRYSVQAVARLLRVDPSTVNGWCQVGRLESIQLRKGGTRWITLKSEDLAELGHPVLRQRKKLTKDKGEAKINNHKLCKKGAL